MRRLTLSTRRRKITVAACAVAAIVAIAAVAALSSGVLAQVAGGNSATFTGVLDFPANRTLEGGRSYRFPDGSWLIDVPEGMRLSYSYTSEGPTGTLHGFTDLGTGSLIGINENTGKVLRTATGDDPAAVRAAEARLDLIEASFRRPPDYVEPARAVAQHTPLRNADGIPILDEDGVFEGGRTYVIPGETPRLLEAPAGISFTFSEYAFDSGGGRYYRFEDAARWWYFLANRETGNLNMATYESNPDARALADAVTAAFADPSP